MSVNWDNVGTGMEIAGAALFMSPAGMLLSTLGEMIKGPEECGCSKDHEDSQHGNSGDEGVAPQSALIADGMAPQFG